MRRLGLLFLVLLAACSAVEPTPARVGAQLPISQWPIPASGSVNITSGDAFVGTRAGVSYKLVAGQGGTCSTDQWVNAINQQGVPSCTQPSLSQITGFLPLTQIAGAYTNGQFPIGNSSTGSLQIGSLSAGTNMTVTNSGGGISVGTIATPVFTSQTINGLSTENGTLTNGTTFSVTSGCGTTGTPVGGATGGSFTSGATSCNPVMALPTATHGWVCDWKDITTPADKIVQSAYATTSCTGTGTVGSGDTILFNAQKGF